MATPKVNATAGTAAASVLNKPKAKIVEDAMVMATEQAMAEGITDDGEILERKLAARQAALEEIAAATAAATDEA